MCLIFLTWISEEVSATAGRDFLRQGFRPNLYLHRVGELLFFEIYIKASTYSVVLLEERRLVFRSPNAI
jgi:hypothetical protein